MNIFISWSLYYGPGASSEQSKMEAEYEGPQSD